MDIPAEAEVVALIDDQPTQWRTATDLYVIGDGQVVSRPLTVGEVTAITAEKSAEQAERTAALNTDALAAKVDAALDANRAYLARTAPTNAQVVAQVRRLTLEASAIIRLLWRRLDTIADTE